MVILHDVKSQDDKENFSIEGPAEPDDPPLSAFRAGRGTGCTNQMGGVQVV